MYCMFDSIQCMTTLLSPYAHTAHSQSNESKPECGRQTLAELLITPVQRIPRIILLLKGRETMIYQYGRAGGGGGGWGGEEEGSGWRGNGMHVST